MGRRYKNKDSVNTDSEQPRIHLLVEMHKKTYDELYETYKGNVQLNAWRCFWHTYDHIFTEREKRKHFWRAWRGAHIFLTRRESKHPALPLNNTVRELVDFKFLLSTQRLARKPVVEDCVHVDDEHWLLLNRRLSVSA